MGYSPKRLTVASLKKQRMPVDELKLLTLPRRSSQAAEHSIRVSEDRFSKAFHGHPQPMSITTHAEGRYIDVNESFLTKLGYERKEVIGRTSLELGIWTTAEARKAFIGNLLTEGRLRDVETAIRAKRGDVRIWLSSAELIELNDEQCILIASTDITETKQAEAKLRDLSGRLIRAQEEERGRIARELHDDLNQQLALLAIELDQMKQNPPHRLATFRLKIGALRERTREISSVVQHLSYQLHPSRLDHLGLVAALRALCRDVSRSSGIDIEFTDSRVPRLIPQEVVLCLYRIAQEALQNIVRHSGATAGSCALSFRSSSLKLRITDAGAGFEVDAQMNRGLGLISMEERLRLVNGELLIASRPSHGTLIEARVPLRSTP